MGEREISLKEIFFGVKKDLVKIGIFTLLCAFAAFAYFSIGENEHFKSTGSLMVIRPRINIQGADLNVTDPLINQRLASTYEQVLMSRSVCNRVEKDLGIELPYDQFQKDVKVYSLKNSEIIGVDVVTNRAEESQKIAELIFKLAPEELTKILDVEEVRVVDQPNLPEIAVGGSKPVKAIKVALVAFVLGIFISFLRVIFRSDIKKGNKER